MKIKKVSMGVDKLEITGYLVDDIQHYLNFLSSKEYFDKKSDAPRIRKSMKMIDKFPCERIFKSRNYDQVALFEYFVVMSGNVFHKNDKIVLNPNKIPDKQLEVIRWIENPQVSRIDINFDIEVDIREVFKRIKRKRVRDFRVFYKSGYPETFYIGGCGSGRMLRIYDKFRESGDSRYIGITRVEFQIRRHFLRKKMDTSLKNVLMELGYYLDYQITEENEEGGQLSSKVIFDETFSDLYYSKIGDIVKCWY